MADKKLEPFKIGDKQRPQVKTAAAGHTKAADAPPIEAQTFGFTRIEGILDKEPPSEVRKKLDHHRGAVQALEADAKTPKDRAAVKKALLAIDRTAELLDYLFRTKQALQMQAAEAAEKAEPAAKGKGKARGGAKPKSK